jgi:NAD+ synthase
MRRIALPRMNPELVLRESGDFIIKEVVKCGYTGGVLGLSGGVDSTCVGAISKRAFDRYNSLSFDERVRIYGAVNPEQNLELLGYMIPSKINNPEDTKDGKRIAERLGIKSQTVDIEPIVEAHRTTNPEAFLNKFDKGNMISRIRANVLSTKAAVERKLVIGTGNHDEDFGVGYYTLFGDGAVHLSPIGALPKRLVREMAAYTGFEEFAYRESSPGLEQGQTAFKDLGYRYEIIVELVSYGREQGLDFNEIVEDEVVQWDALRQIKEYEKTFGKKKFDNVESMVEDIFRRNNIARAKSEIVSPPIAQVTLEFIKGYNPLEKR